jgi:hypothetical protein
MSFPPPQCLAETTPTERTEAREAPSPDMPAITVADSAHAEQANRAKSSAINFRARHYSA